MDDTFLKKLFLEHQECPDCPSPQEVADFFVDLLGILFPDFSRRSFETEEAIFSQMNALKIQLDRILRVEPKASQEKTVSISDLFFEELPNTYEKIMEDAEAMFQGDPAAKSRSEVIRTYPGFYAIAAYRIAHALLKYRVKVIPRIITEHAHGKTGIDIHPGAKIGHHFCVDHGTGVVIGETAVIGNYVKIYQGVTLGALSVDKKDAEMKRHPTIEDNVVIYAGATILGGETIIGESSVIGGNVWLTKSVPAQSKIYYQAKMFNSKTDQTDLYIYKEN